MYKHLLNDKSKPPSKVSHMKVNRVICKVTLSLGLLSPSNPSSHPVKVNRVIPKVTLSLDLLSPSNPSFMVSAK